MVHGTDTGIVGVERDVDSLGVSTLHVRVGVLLSYVYRRILENPPLCHNTFGVGSFY